MPTDPELLRRYAVEKSEPAFAELVRRHIGLVYAVALRQCGGDAHLAEDVTQRVFTDLARKARSLDGHAVLGGWLYRSTQFAASDVVRAERRRRVREQEAAIMQEIFAPVPSGSAADWRKLAPVIDEVIGELNERDRDAVVLRFFEGRPFAEIGAALRLTEDAARMRVDRALEKLRTALVRRGIASTTAALGVALAGQAAGAAPAGLAASVTGAVLAGTATSGGAGVGLAFLTMSKIKIGILGAVVVAGLATAVVEVRANRALRRELGAFRDGEDDLARLQRESRRLNVAVQTSAAGNPEAGELTKLQARIGQLRARPDGVTDASLRPVGYLGRATAEAACVTFIAAFNAGDLDAVAQLLVFPDDTKEHREAFMATFSDAVRAKYRTPERLLAAALFNIREGVPNSDPGVAFQTLSIRENDAGQLRVSLWVRSASGRESEARDVFQSTPEGWAILLRPMSDPRVVSLVQARLDPQTGDPVRVKE